MVIVNPHFNWGIMSCQDHSSPGQETLDLTDVPFLIIGYDGIGELFVHFLILCKTAAFIHDFGLRGIWNNVVESWP